MEGADRGEGGTLIQVANVNAGGGGLKERIPPPTQHEKFLTNDNTEMGNLASVHRSRPELMCLALVALTIPSKMQMNYARLKAASVA